MLFGRKKRLDHGGNPQYNAGVAPAPVPGSYNPDMKVKRHDATVTSGFHDELAPYNLSYGYRPQPDRGGALNYAYENYALPLQNVCGAWMVAQTPYRPIGSQPVAYFQVSPETSIGGLIPGQVISQPLLNPNDPGSGFDIYS